MIHAAAVCRVGVGGVGGVGLCFRTLAARVECLRPVRRVHKTHGLLDWSHILSINQRISVCVRTLIKMILGVFFGQSVRVHYEQ